MPTRIRPLHVARGVARREPLAVLLGRIADNALVAGEADRVHVERIIGHDVEVVASAGADAVAIGTRVPYAGSLAQVVLDAGEPEIVGQDVLDEHAIGAAAAEWGGAGSALVLPMIGDAGAIGALLLLRAPGRPAFSDDEADRLQLLADLAAIALQHERLREERERRANAPVPTPNPLP